MYTPETAVLGTVHVAGGDLAGAVTAVVAEPEDVDVVVRRRRVDLELLSLAGVHAHRRGEPLDRRVAGALDLPVGGRIARELVLARDGIGTRCQRGLGPSQDENLHDKRQCKQRPRSAKRRQTMGCAKPVQTVFYR